MKQQALHTDSKGRINLGHEFASCYFLLQETAKGEFSLKKAAIIPERDLALMQDKETVASVQRGLQQAKAGKLKRNAINLDTYDDQ